MISSPPALLKQQVQAELEFTHDIVEFFSGRRAGHLSKWLYSNPQFEGDKVRGTETWKRGIEEAKRGGDYYVFLKEKSVIQNAIPRLKDIFSRKLRMIDLGPGSEEAIRDKIMPFVQAYTPNVVEYVGVDVSRDTLVMAKKEVLAAGLPMEARSLERDFIQDSFFYGDRVSREVAVIFGLTLCNMTIDPRVPGLPSKLLTSYFQRLKSHFSARERFLMVTQDVNQDPESLKRAYEAFSDHYMRLLYRIQRDTPVTSGFDPEGFRLEVDYFKDTQACALCFVLKKDMSFSIEDEAFTLRKDQRLYFHNAFKFDVQTFLSAARTAGFDVVQSVEEKENPCILHVLKPRVM